MEQGKGDEVGISGKGILTKGLLTGLLLVFLAGSVPAAGPPSPAQDPASAAAQPPLPAPGLGPGQEEVPDWQARLELARVLSYLKRYPESIDQYRRVLKEKPDFAAAKIELARVHHWNGQPEEALALLAGLDRKALPPEERLLLADLLLAKKEYGQAEAIFREHLKANPYDLATRLKLAEMLSWTKQYDQSLAQYEIILKARPKDRQVRRKYAFVLIWSGRHEQAAQELAQTLD